MRTDHAQIMEAPPAPAQRPADPYVAQFETFSAAIAAGHPHWMQNLRKAAISQFAELGLPTVKHEEWKYTNVAPVAKLPFKPVSSAKGNVSRSTVDRLSYPDTDRLVFVNGTFNTDLSSTGGDARILPLCEAIAAREPELEKHLAHYAPYNENAFTALNTAFFTDGALIVIEPRRHVARPIHLIFIATGLEAGETVHSRNLIIAGRESKAVILETHASLDDAPYVTNSVTEARVEEAAQLEHLKFQKESLQAFHFATVQGSQSRDSRFISHSISLGARLARNDIRIKLEGPGAEGIMNGLYIGKDDQLLDHHTVFDHAQPHCESHEFYHGVLADRSQGVFNGKIFVRQDAQKTNAKQSNRNLLLSNDAGINTKPQLEIFADDVKCTHGATIGQIDEDALFYLRCRGIPHETARRMLIYAFASDVVNRISVEPVRAALETLLHERFD